MTDFIEALNRFSSRYQRALLIKSGVLAVLLLGVCGTLARRLSGASLHPIWWIGVPGALAALGALGLTWWLRRRWVSQDRVAALLDRTLGLQQRLITAQEFANAQEPPALYSLLLEDVASRYSTQQIRLPRPFDRTAAALSVILLLLLLWPGHAASPMRVAQAPAPSSRLPQPPAPPPLPPPTPQQQQQQDQQNRSAPQASSSSGGSGQQGSAQQGQGTGDKQQATSDTQQGPSDKGQATSNQQPATSNKEPGTGDGTQHPSRSMAGTADGKQQAASNEQHPADGTQQAAGSQQQRETGGSEKKEAQGRSSQEAARQQQGTSDKGQGARDKGQGTADGRQQQADGTQQSAGNKQQGGQSGSEKPAGQGQGGAQAGAGQPSAGVGQSVGQQEALKAEIQQLLKDVSGELQALQSQLALAQAQQKPSIGTGTDPNLYEPPMAIDRTAGNALPIQLQTDTAQTKRTRPGGGTGTPSKDAADAAPHTQAEDAQLSETPLEETPTDRQSVPPEYRDVFDQLRRRK